MTKSAKKMIETRELKKLEELATLTSRIHDARDLRKKITVKQREAILKKSKASTRNLRILFSEPSDNMSEIESAVTFYSI